MKSIHKISNSDVGAWPGSPPCLWRPWPWPWRMRPCLDVGLVGQFLVLVFVGVKLLLISVDCVWDNNQTECGYSGYPLPLQWQCWLLRSWLLHLILYVVKRQLAICFKSSKPIQIVLCIRMSLSIHLHGLHLDAQYGQTWHLSTQLRNGERTRRRFL